MNEKHVYQQEEMILFRSTNRKRRSTLNKGVVGATAIFGSLSMVLSVVPIQTMAAEKNVDVVSSTDKQATQETAPIEQQVTKAIADPISSTTKNTETTSEEITPSEETNEGNKGTTPSEETNEGNKGTTPSEETNEEGNKGTTPSEETNEGNKGTTPSEETNEGNKGTTPSENENEGNKETAAPIVEKNVVVPAETQSTNATQPLDRVDFSDQWSSTFTTEETAEAGSIHYEKNQTTEEFITEIAESARKVGQEKDLYASVMIAQAILESGSGSSSLSQEPHYNLFGIKGDYKGKSVSFNTQEDDGTGNLNTISANFRSYDSYEASFEDYADLMKNGISGNTHFYEGVWKTTATSYEEATAFLTGKYATDTQYNQKLNGLIETYGLTQYDQPKDEGIIKSTSISAQGYMIPVTNYVISSGFGSRGGEFHRGLDLAATTGEAVLASKAGKVLTVESHPSWGNYVVVLHSDGSTTLYAHLSAFKTSVGQTVEQGQVIGLVGTTGNSTGPHLHFEICSDASLLQSKLVDPQAILFG